MSIPESLNLSVKKTVDTMEIETSILNPIVINQDFARFVLERRGILDVGSSFQFVVNCDVNPATGCYLPIKTGIHALIKTATLRIGNIVVATSDEYAFYQTIRRSFKSCEEKSQKDMIKNGTTDVVCPYSNGDGAYQLRDVNTPNQGNPQTQEVLETISIVAKDASNGPSFSIRLNELFPSMLGVSLPLYLITEPVSIELTFNRQVANAVGRNVACFGSGVIGANVGITQNLEECIFLADYLTYTDDTMNQNASVVMSDKGMVIPYQDLILTTSSVPATANPIAGQHVKQFISRDIALSGMTVKALLAHHQASTHTANNILGVYESKAQYLPESYNIRVNDQQLYPRELTNPCMKQNEISKVFGTDISIGNFEYSYNMITDDDGALTNRMTLGINTLNGHALSSIEGNQYYTGVDFTISNSMIAGDGVLVGQKPIQVNTNYRRAPNNESSYLIRYYALVDRVMTIQGGRVSVSK